MPGDSLVYGFSLYAVVHGGAGGARCYREKNKLRNRLSSETKHWRGLAAIQLNGDGGKP